VSCSFLRSLFTLQAETNDVACETAEHKSDDHPASVGESKPSDETIANLDPFSVRCYMTCVAIAGCCIDPAHWTQTISLSETVFGCKRGAPFFVYARR